MLNRKIFSLTVIIFFSSTNIQSESYSSYRLDDSLYFTSGVRKLSSGGRIDNIARLNNSNMDTKDSTTLNNDYSWGWNIYSNTNYRTQKGGSHKSQTNFYNLQGFISPEIYTKYSLRDWDFFFVGSFTSSAHRFKKTESNQKNLFDFESLIGVKNNSMFFQAGRGFYRTDKFGFLFNNILNFVEVGHQIHFKEIKIEIRGLKGYSNLRDQNLTHIQWDSNPYSIQGGFIRGGIQNWGLDWNIYGLNKQMKSRQPSLGDNLIPGEDFNYFGTEIGYAINNNLELDIGGVSWSGFMDRYIPTIPQESPRIYKNGILYYLNLEYSIQKFKFGLSGILEMGEKFKKIDSQNRFMGGESSILLNLRDDPIFLPLDFSKNTALEGGGIFWTYKSSYDKENSLIYRLNLNSITSFFGSGKEAIASIGLESSNRGYILLSLAHARINPNSTQSEVIQEFSIPLALEKYERIFFSGGIVF